MYICPKCSYAYEAQTTDASCPRCKYETLIFLAGANQLKLEVSPFNRHLDHDATCFCCKHLCLNYKTNPLNNKTSLIIFCMKNHFNKWDMPENDWHDAIGRALTCPQYEAKSHVPTS